MALNTGAVSLAHLFHKVGVEILFDVLLREDVLAVFVLLTAFQHTLPELGEELVHPLLCFLLHLGDVQMELGLVLRERLGKLLALLVEVAGLVFQNLLIHIGHIREHPDLGIGLPHHILHHSEDSLGADNVLLHNDVALQAELEFKELCLVELAAPLVGGTLSARLAHKLVIAAYAVDKSVGDDLLGYPCEAAHYLLNILTGVESVDHIDQHIEHTEPLGLDVAGKIYLLRLRERQQRGGSVHYRVGIDEILCYLPVEVFEIGKAGGIDNAHLFQDGSIVLDVEVGDL